MKEVEFDPNLVLEGYGIKLKRLKHEDIELVRQWRNDPKIQKTMIFRMEITPDMQEKWFTRMNTCHNYYFLIEYQGRYVGLINEKDIDYEKRCGESGIFLYDDTLFNSGVSVKASFLMKKYMFHTLGLLYEYGHVLADNKKAIAYNLALGGKLSSSEDPGILLMKRTKEDFEKQLLKYDKFLNRM